MSCMSPTHQNTETTAEPSYQFQIRDEICKPSHHSNHWKLMKTGVRSQSEITVCQ